MADDRITEGLAKLLEDAKARAEGWLGQRRSIADQLTSIRDTASGLLQQLTSGAASSAGAGRPGRRGRPKGSRNAVPAAARRGPGRPKGSGKKRGRRKRSKLSAKARKAISDAQKARWARQKAAEKKS